MTLFPGSAQRAEHSERYERQWIARRQTPLHNSVALLSTKVPILLGSGFWGFSLPKLPRYGFWSMVHEARTDWSMLLGALFLLIVGAGAWSADARLARGPSRRTA